LSHVARALVDIDRVPTALLAGAEGGGLAGRRAVQLALVDHLAGRHVEHVEPVALAVAEAAVQAAAEDHHPLLVEADASGGVADPHAAAVRTRPGLAEVGLAE